MKTRSLCFIKLKRNVTGDDKKEKPVQCNFLILENV